MEATRSPCLGFLAGLELFIPSSMCFMDLGLDGQLLGEPADMALQVRDVQLNRPGQPGIFGTHIGLHLGVFKWLSLCRDR